MDIFDLIKELRKGEPNIEKAAKVMKVLGGICVGGALCNYTFYYIGPFEESPFNFSPLFPYLALTGLLFLGGLFLYSSKAIKALDPQGKRVGQVAVILLLALFIGFMFFAFPLDQLPLDHEGVSLFFTVFVVIFIVQFGVPAYYGVRYLGRLPTSKSRFGTDGLGSGHIDSTVEEESLRSSSKSKEKYCDALLPFGVPGTFALIIAVPFISVFAIERHSGLQQMPIMIVPAVFFILFISIIYNFFPSPFQKKRDKIASFTGGGSIFLFNGSWPFFRLLIYHDGLEIRVMFHRFFIPYDKIEAMPEKTGFFSRGILIKSNLPDLPSGIRYQGFGMKKVVQLIAEKRCKFKSED
ncbi:MAG: hypothetical protein OEV42_06455 [Deltaproteobacteria bacterium]|nr:hypothetical protein [Deltaproteobacteria bacterium]